jgi:murein DD-endopeptidase MepM/ murein hydrolase activator NlpD
LSAIGYGYALALGALAKVNALTAPFTGHAGQAPAGPAAAPTVMARRKAPAARPVTSAVIAQRTLSAPSAVPFVARMIEVAEQESAEPALAAVPMTKSEVDATRRAAARTPPALSGQGFLWPVAGEVASGFGEKPNGARNNGIDIAARQGTPVQAAENGIVVYSGDGIPGYGNMLLVSHADGYTTAYAHNHDLLADVGEVVTRGQTIATVGATGGVASPQLHFELRAGKTPLDPLAHLETAGTRVASTR